MGWNNPAVRWLRSDVFAVRMARVNITVPDDLHRRAREAGLSVSQSAQRALAAELDRLDKIAGLDAYLAELDSKLGPIGDAERTDAGAWADQVVGQSTRQHSA